MYYTQLGSNLASNTVIVEFVAFSDLDQCVTQTQTAHVALRLTRLELPVFGDENIRSR